MRGNGHTGVIVAFILCVCARALPCVLVNPLRSYQTINDGLNKPMGTFTHKTRTTVVFVVFFLLLS